MAAVELVEAYRLMRKSYEDSVSEAIPKFNLTSMVDQTLRFKFADCEAIPGWVEQREQMYDMCMLTATTEADAETCDNLLYCTVLENVDITATSTIDIASFISSSADMATVIRGTLSDKLNANVQTLSDGYQKLSVRGQQFLKDSLKADDASIAYMIIQSLVNEVSAESLSKIASVYQQYQTIGLETQDATLIQDTVFSTAYMNNTVSVQFLSSNVVSNVFAGEIALSGGLMSNTSKTNWVPPILRKWKTTLLVFGVIVLSYIFLKLAVFSGRRQAMQNAY